MAKILHQSSRTHVYSVDDKKAFALIGFDTLHQDSVITLIRETGEKIPGLLSQKSRPFNTKRNIGLTMPA